MRAIFRPRAAGIFTVVALVVSLVWATAAVAGPAKPYSATVTPSPVGAGSTATFSFTITNLTNQGLGSANVTVPTNWTLVSVGAVTKPPGKNWTAAVSSSSPTTTVELRSGSNGDKLVTGESVSVQIRAKAPCSGGGTTWGVVVKQSNQFLGSGNDFVLSGSAPSTSITGSCHLAFGIQPSTTQAGSPIGPPSGTVTVLLEDGNNQPLTGNPLSVTVGLGAGSPNATLGGTLTRSLAANGIATFDDLTITKAATGYTLAASASGVSGASSSSFDITPGPAHHVTFTVQPSNVRAGAVMAPAVKVEVRDQYENLETQDNSTQVNLGIGTNPSGGTLTGGGLVTVSGGVATYASLSVDKVGSGYTLTAASTGLIGATSNAFDVTPGPAVALRIVDPIGDQVTNTSFGVTVQTLDAQGNVGAPVSASTKVHLSVHNSPVLNGSGKCVSYCSGRLSATDVTIPAGSGAGAQFTASYSDPDNNITLDATVVSGDSLSPDTSGPFSVYSFLETQTLTTGSSTTLTSSASSPNGPCDTTQTNNTCVTALLTNGANGATTLFEGNCDPTAVEPCLGSLIGLVGGPALFKDQFGNPLYTAAHPLEVVIELDKSISGQRGASSFQIGVTFNDGSVLDPIPDCQVHGQVNPGVKACLDDQHRQNDGDTELHVLVYDDVLFKTHA